MAVTTAVPGHVGPPAAPAAQARAHALTTRFADFWLLGGASLLVWFLMFSLQGFRAAWAIDQHFKNLTVTTASLSLLVNYPHFLISYKLAYSRGRSFILEHWWQMLFVPAAMIAIFAWAYSQYAVPVGELSVVVQLRQWLAPLGTNAQLLSGPRLGDVLVGLTFDVMLFTVGWHYTKQTFGCTMVYAYFDQYPMTPRQRTIVKWSLLSVWWLTFADGNRQSARQAFSQFAYYSFDMPDVAVPIAWALLIGGVALTLHQVVWANYKAHGRLPSANMAVPYVALLAWWLPVTRQSEFYFLLTPFFHSLQYLTFVYKMEDTRIRGLSHPEVRGTLVALGVVVAGWMAFEFVPNEVDTALGTFNAWQMFFFFTSAMLFINIHHYFLDNVLWRFKDPQVRQYLLG